MSHIDQNIFCCALALDKHFIENPVTLSCGHSICKLCVPKKTEVLVCKICGEKNEIDLNKVKESVGMKKLLSLNLCGMLQIILDRYNESVTNIEGTLAQFVR
jgi:transcription elongation factor Elf1